VFQSKEDQLFPSRDQLARLPVERYSSLFSNVAQYNTIQYNTKQICIAPFVASESEALGDSV